MTRPSSHTSGMQCAKAWCLQWLCLLFLSGLKPFLQLLSLVHCSVNVWYVHCKNATKTGINLQRIQRRKLLTDFQLLWHFDTIVHGKIQTFQKYGYKINTAGQSMICGEWAWDNYFQLRIPSSEWWTLPVPQESTHVITCTVTNLLNGLLAFHKLLHFDCM